MSITLLFIYLCSHLKDISVVAVVRVLQMATECQMSSSENVWNFINTCMTYNTKRSMKEAGDVGCRLCTEVVFVFSELFDFSSISFTKFNFEEITFSMTSNTKFCRIPIEFYLEFTSETYEINMLRNKNYFG